MYEGTFIIASGPVIIEDGKLLVNKDEKERDFSSESVEFEKRDGGKDY